MPITTIVWILIVVLLVLAIVGSPAVNAWPHGYGWYPSGGLGLILLILLILILLGRI